MSSRDSKNWQMWFTFSRQHRTWSFYVVVLQRTEKKCTKNYNTRAQPFFCSLNLFFSAIAVAVGVFLSSLFRRGWVDWVASHPVFGEAINK